MIWPTVLGLEFWDLAKGLGFRVLGFGFSALGFGSGCRVLSFGLGFGA